MASLRILLVGGRRESAEGIERTLRRDLPAGVSIVRVARCPNRTDRFDGAIVLASEGRVLPARIPDLPTVVVGPEACVQGCAALVRRGVQHGLSEECATCSRQPSLAPSLMWAIERDRLVRDLDRARRHERHTALHDPLTGLPNVRLYRERLRHLLAQGRRTGKRFALLFVDLDRFKEVNDSAGHAAGDRLLRRVADRIQTCIRETDTVARRGGDEFVVLLDDLRRAKDAARVAGKILRRISRPTVVLGTVLRPSASIGIAIFPDDGGSENVLERRADQAMYRAKKLGAGTHRSAGSRRQVLTTAVVPAAAPRTPPPSRTRAPSRRRRSPG